MYKKLVLLTLILSLLLNACCGITTGAHAVVQATTAAGLPPEVTHVVVTLDVKYRKSPEGHRVTGECRKVGEDPVEYWIIIHVGEIAQISKHAMTSAWIEDTIDHELMHARATCSDADH